MSAVNVVLNEWFSPASSNGAIIFSSLVEKELIRKVSFHILLVKILMTHSPRKQSRRNIVVLFSFTFVKVHLEVRILLIQLLISIFLTDTQVFFNITIKKLGFLVNVVGPCVQVLQELKIIILSEQGTMRVILNISDQIYTYIMFIPWTSHPWRHHRERWRLGWWGCCQTSG